jgi:hypothetical protein
MNEKEREGRTTFNQQSVRNKNAGIRIYETREREKERNINSINLTKGQRNEMYHKK